MAENVKSLRRRLRSVRNTKQITRAMEMVSAAKLRRAQDLLMAGRPYAGKLQELLGRLAASAPIAHPLFEKREVRKRLLVAISADRGLAGAFNTSIVKRTEALLRSADVPTDLACVGKKVHDYFRTKSWNVAFSITDFAGKLTSERSNELADHLKELFLSGEYDEIVILYNAFVSTMVYQTTEEQLLPLDPESLLGEAQQADAGHGDYLLEPTPDRVFASLLPRYVRSKVYIILAENFTSEHSARMIAMTAATKNCQELVDTLTLRMNKVRQAAITKEILEIVGGAEALKG